MSLFPLDHVVVAARFSVRRPIVIIIRVDDALLPPAERPAPVVVVVTRKRRVPGICTGGQLDRCRYDGPSRVVLAVVDAVVWVRNYCFGRDIFFFFFARQEDEENHESRKRLTSKRYHGQGVVGTVDFGAGDGNDPASRAWG